MTVSFTKVVVNIPDDVVQELQELSRVTGSTMTDLIALSIRLSKFLSDIERRGGKILIENADRTMEQVIRLA